MAGLMDRVADLERRVTELERDRETVLEPANLWLPCLKCGRDACVCGYEVDTEKRA